MTLQVALQTLVDALTIGALYGLVGVSFNVMYRPTGVLNFAQGDIVLVGAVVSWLALEVYALPWPVALLAVLAVGAVFGVLEERVAIWPVLRRSSTAHGWVLSTLAVSILVQNAVGIMLSDEPRIVRPAPGLSVHPGHLGPLSVSTYQVAIWGFALLVTGLLWLFYRSPHGRAVLALAEDRDAALLRGVRAGRLVVFSFALGAAVAALAGLVAAPVTFAAVSLSPLFIIKGFEAAAIGGIGDDRGALLGGAILGIVEGFAAQLLSAGYRDAASFLAFMLVLLIWPLGLFGKAALRRV
jgi:branched-chain amino acid transport system permease protein